MANVFAADLSGMAEFSAVNEGAAATIATAGSADSAGMVGAAATALGPVGADYLAAYASAQANNLAATMLAAYLHAAIGDATSASAAAIVRTDKN